MKAIVSWQSHVERNARHSRVLPACLLAMLAQLWSVPCAAEIGKERPRRAMGVVMVIGGTAPDGHTDTASTSEQPTMTNPVAGKNSERLSLVLEPGKAFAAGTLGGTSPSATSRVLALSPLIKEAARATQIDDALLMAVIDVESGGNTQAVSPKGATGLMRLMPATGANHGASNLFDARENIAAGAHYLQTLIRQFGDVPLALAAYNAGEGAVQKYGGRIPPYAETVSYVPKVLARYRWYRDAMSASAGASLQFKPRRESGRFVSIDSGRSDD